MRIVFTAEIDATDLVNAYQVSTSDHAIVGGASPNDFIPVNGLLKEQIFEHLKECNKVKHGPMATEVKVFVVYFQKTPKGMPPFFTLTGHPQTTNKNNQFELMVFEACEMAAMKDRNSVHLNESTYGVACEVKFNKTLTISYLNGGKIYLSMPNSNENLKNCQGQMVSGTSAASIGNFVVYPWMFKMVNVKK